MNIVQKLEKQLQLAKAEDAKKALQKDLEDIIETYQGKAYGSRLFEKAAKCASETALYFEKFFIKDDKIYGILWAVNVIQYGPDYKYTKNSYSYSRYMREECFSSTNYNIQYQVHQRLPYKAIELTPAKFMSLFHAATTAEAVLREPFIQNLSEHYGELIRMGDSTKEKRVETAIKALKLDMIDMTKHPRVLDEIQYAELPMFHQQRWLPREYAAKLLKYQIGLWEEDMRSIWTDGRRAAYLQRRIDIVQQFINTL